jgi:hypothetical protein
MTAASVAVRVAVKDSDIDHLDLALEDRPSHGAARARS